MRQQLAWSDLMGLGFLNFAFFFGAGNLIFPPFAGAQAGTFFTSAMLGFLLTAAGLPFLSLMAAARAGGGLPAMGRHLPAWVVSVMAVVLYTAIGPALATPRTALVAFEMGAKPLLGLQSSGELAVYSAVFFSVALYFALNRGKLLDHVGKLLTPLLMLLLAALAIGVFSTPYAAPGTPQAPYSDAAFTAGVLAGYNTMDSLGGLLFGMLNVAMLRGRGVSEPKDLQRAMLGTALIAAGGLALVYASLFYLGATSGALAIGTDNGGTVITRYVEQLFGPLGQWALGIMVTLACLTTAVGLLSACGDYFARQFPKLSYRGWVLVFAVASGTVANIGLGQLLKLSVPLLYALYPMAISLIVLTLIAHWLPAPQRGYRLVVGVAFVMGLLDAAKASGLALFAPMVELAEGYVPGYSQSLGWLLPTLLAFGVARLMKQEPAPVLSQAWSQD